MFSSKPITDMELISALFYLERLRLMVKHTVLFKIIEFVI